jgi:hypothetical protein
MKSSVGRSRFDYDIMVLGCDKIVVATQGTVRFRWCNVPNQRVRAADGFAVLSTNDRKFAAMLRAVQSH